MSKKELRAPRGTRDFYPEDQRLRSWLFDHFRDVARSFAFEEVDVPIVEHAELFIRKAGEEIVDQLYHFHLHDRHLALRPELTPSIARLVMARAGGLRLPVRWFSIGQNWRYERMTRGRSREHYQWNVEILGESDVTVEAELIAAISLLLERLGLGPDAVKIRINSRALLEETLRRDALADRPDAFAPLCVIIDKLAKIGAEAVLEQLTDPSGGVALPEPAARAAIDALSAKSLEAAARGVPADSPGRVELLRLFELLAAYGLEDRVVFDASVVRGLAYYTGVVFEAFDTGGRLRSVCGGGRYDRLMETLGGPAMPAAGFGFGDVVILELLKDRKLLPKLGRGLEDVVFALSEAQRLDAVHLASRLRAEGRSVELVLGPARAKRVFAQADQSGAARVLILGEDEAARGVVRVHDMKTGEEHEVTL